LKTSKKLPVIGYYNKSVILTYLGLVFSVIGIVSALDFKPRIAILCLMVCGFCDMFDGAIARRCDRTDDEKAFGVQIDSLCDLVCFGILPAIIGYSVGNTSLFGTGAMAFYLLAVVIRLGYFNVQEINRARDNGGKRKHYEGLPVTTVAIILPAALMLEVSTRFSLLRFFNVALVALGVAFLSKIKVHKPYKWGLVALALVGAGVFALVWRFGGSIQCLRTTSIAMQ